ncbi:ADP-ribosylation/Crystallin J1 [Haematococcus lacustris]
MTPRTFSRTSALTALLAAFGMLAASRSWFSWTRSQNSPRNTRASATSVQPSVTMATLPEEKIRERAKAAVLGGLVADASSMPLHWIYDPTKLQAALAQRPGAAAAPEFHTPHACPFYQAPLGDLSPYGYELQALLAHLVKAGATTSLDGDACAKGLAASYAASTGYLNKSSKHVKEAVAAGTPYPGTGHPEDAQANAFVKAPAVVALLAGHPALLPVMEVAVRVQQNNDKAVEAGLAGALLLEKVVLGASVEEALSWALSPDSGISPATKAQLQAALELKAQPFAASVSQLGASCGLPASLQGSVLGARKFTSFVEGVRANMLAGGDNCSRSALLGALLAAQEGSIAAIPESWRAKTNKFADYEALADKLVAQRS